MCSCIARKPRCACAWTRRAARRKNGTPLAAACTLSGDSGPDPRADRGLFDQQLGDFAHLVQGVDALAAEVLRQRLGLAVVLHAPFVRAGVRANALAAIGFVSVCVFELEV